MCQGGEVATGAHGPELGPPRVYACVEQIEQALHEHDAAPRVSSSERVGAQHHQRAHRLSIHRIAHSGRVAAHQVLLERRALVGRDSHVGEAPEAGGDTIDRLARAHETRAEGPRVGHTHGRCPRPPGPRLRPERYAAHVFETEGSSVEYYVAH